MEGKCIYRYYGVPLNEEELEKFFKYGKYDLDDINQKLYLKYKNITLYI